MRDMMRDMMLAGPAGADCAGSTNPPINQAGYWGFESAPDEFYECDAGNLCKSEYACHQGLKKHGCSYLRRDYFEISGYPTPIECPRRRVVRITALVIAASCVLVFWFFVNGVIVQRSVPMTIFLDNIQVVAIITAGAGSIHFPSVLDVIDPIFQLLLFDVDVVSPNCVLRWGPFEGFLLQLALALLGFFVLAIVWTYQIAIAVPATKRKYFRNNKKNRRRSSGSTRDPWTRLLWRRIRLAYSSPRVSRAVSSAFSLVELTYPTVTINCFEAMRCKAFADGRRYMIYDINIRCGQRRHLTLQILAALATVIIVFGVPHFVYVAVWREMRRHVGVHQPNFQERFGFAVRDFRSPYFTWKIVLSYRFIAICAASALLEHADIQLAWISLIMAVMTTLQWMYAPFKNSRLNLLEGLGSGFCLAFALSLHALEHKKYRRVWAVAFVLGLSIFTVVSLYMACIDVGIAHSRFKGLVRVLFHKMDVYEALRRNFEARKLNVKRLPAAVIVRMHARKWQPLRPSNDGVGRASMGLEDFLQALARHRFLTSSDLVTQLVAVKRKLPPPTNPDLIPEYYLTLLQNIGVSVDALNATKLAEYLECIQPSVTGPMEQSMSHLPEFALFDRASRVVNDMIRALAAGPMHDWLFDQNRTADDFAMAVSAAKNIQQYVSNDSAIGPLSFDDRSQFWREIVRQNPGILNIVAYEMTFDERELFYGVLIRLQKSTREAHRKIESGEHAHFLADLIVSRRVVEEHLSTILYFMLASPPEETADFIDLMTQLAHTRQPSLPSDDRQSHHLQWRDSSVDEYVIDDSVRASERASDDDELGTNLLLSHTQA